MVITMFTPRNEEGVASNDTQVYVKKSHFHESQWEIRGRAKELLNLGTISHCISLYPNFNLEKYYIDKHLWQEN